MADGEPEAPGRGPPGLAAIDRPVPTEAAAAPRSNFSPRGASTRVETSPSSSRAATVAGRLFTLEQRPTSGVALPTTLTGWQRILSQVTEGPEMDPVRHLWRLPMMRTDLTFSLQCRHNVKDENYHASSVRHGSQLR